MLSYPASKLSTPDNQIQVLHITDLHVSRSGSPIVVDTAATYTCQQSFEAVLRQALHESVRCDVIVVTGDLVNEVHADSYDRIFSILKDTQIPFVCIAGNHDVTDERGSDLPFLERKLIARSMDPRLVDCHVIESDTWQLLLLNSAVAGKVLGQITPTHIEWLCKRLSDCDKPALIALHHHVVPVDSDWIDAQMVTNAAYFWQRMAAFEHLQVIIHGHTHQEQVYQYQGVTIYSTPSTCYQFKPLADDFAYDENARPGYRWLQLANNGQVVSWVKRLDTCSQF